MEKVNLADELSRFEDHWNPRIVAELNGVLLFEPASTVNTGEVREARTVTNPEHL